MDFHLCLGIGLVNGQGNLADLFPEVGYDLDHLVITWQAVFYEANAVFGGIIGPRGIMDAGQGLKEFEPPAFGGHFIEEVAGASFPILFINGIVR